MSFAAENLRIITNSNVFGDGRTIIYLNGQRVSLENFLLAAEYVLTNTDLVPNDPRLQFVRCVNSMHEVAGYTFPGGKRLKSEETAVLAREPNELVEVEIVETPTGVAPEYVRKHMVGIRSAAQIVSPDTVEVGILTSKPVLGISGNRGGVTIEVKGFLEKLREKSPAAAQWLEKNVSEEVTHFVFGRDEVMIL